MPAAATGGAVALASRPSVAVLAHDINNLLGVVVTNLDLLMERTQDRPEVTALLNEVIEAAVRASDLARTLIDGPSRESEGHPAFNGVSDARRAAGVPATILVVDDNSELRRAVVRQLLDLDYLVVEAGDGPAALMILNSQPVDLLFTDVVMPGGMSGFDLARLVLARWPAMKAVITSAFPELEPVGDSITAGKLRRLTKPYRKGELAQTLREVLEA